ncbi:dihydrofolate reductase family protein [Kribbella sp. NPDC056861]|uniref:dihydrofolate reductase family protein n=1 Tax=Kribbella sp. NPDC056861 TaxID=3154857 RepID=UPI003438A8BD
MSKLVVYMSMSLDGFIAAEGDDAPGRGLGVGGEPLHAWMAEGGEHGRGVNAGVLEEMMTSGAVIVGRRSFELANEWSGDHHDGVPIFVLTRQLPDHPAPGVAQYVTGIESTVAKAKAAAAAGDRDVMMHGAELVRALLAVGLVDELVISLVPVLLGRGRRLFDELPGEMRQLRLVESLDGEGVLHLRYQVC